MEEKKQRPPVNFGAVKRIAKLILKKYSNKFSCICKRIIIYSSTY